MFQKKNSPAPVTAVVRTPTDSSRAAGVPSIVSADMEFRGDLTGAGDVQVDGKVFGKIDVGHLVIAEGGSVDGEIQAKAVRISGSLNGTIRAGTVSLTATARVQGDIWHDILEIEAGAQLEGQCKRIGNRPADNKPRLVTDSDTFAAG